MEAVRYIERTDMGSSTYHEQVRAAGLEVHVSGRWASIGRSNRRQGWKLHITTVPIIAGRLLDLVVPILRDHGTPFKLAAEEHVLLQLNEGSLGPTQIGKFITIYPNSDSQCRKLAKLLTEQTSRFFGPAIATDLRLGSVVYTRYGTFRSRNKRDRLGHYYSVLSNRTGGCRRDDREVPFAMPPGVRFPFRDFVQHHKSEPSTGVGKLFGPGFLLVDVLKSDPTGSVFLALDMRDPSSIATKIIKEGRAHCMSDRWGRDARDRLRHQLSIHRTVAGKAAVPVAEAYFEVEGNGYLVLSHVDGTDVGAQFDRPFGALERHQQLRLLTILSRLVDAVGSLHACGFVHRDLAPTNIRVSTDDTVTLLDLELAYTRASGERPYTQGTAGFMSPEQEQGLTPDFSQDVYSIGAIMVWVLTGIDPRRVLFAEEAGRVAQIEALGGVPAPLASLVASCLSSDPGRRPGISGIQEWLETVHASVHTGGDTSDAPPRWKQPIGELKAKIVDALPKMLLGLLDHTLVDDHTGLWLSPKSGAHDKADSRGSFALHRSAHRGVAGILYMLARFAQAGIRESDLASKAQVAVNWLLEQATTPDSQMPGLHFGEAGIAVAIAEAISAGLIARDRFLDRYFNEALNGPLDWPDLTHGAAGQGTAALICGQVVQDKGLLKASGRCARFLINSQDADGGWTLPEGVVGMSGGRYLGFAHGTAGIVYFLAACSALTNDPNALRAAIAGADFLLRNADDPKSSCRQLSWPTKVGDEETWRWWCHGGPGIALCFLKLHEVTRNPDYLDIAARAAGSISEQIRHSNLSQCHGLSGLGEVSLELALHTGDEQWDLRSKEIASCLFSLARASTEGGLSWLVEDTHHPTSDLMIGSGGVAHFLLRFCHRGLSPPLLLRSTTRLQPLSKPY